MLFNIYNTKWSIKLDIKFFIHTYIPIAKHYFIIKISKFKKFSFEN